MIEGENVFFLIHSIHDFSVDIKGLLFMIIATLKKSDLIFFFWSWCISIAEEFLICKGCWLFSPLKRQARRLKSSGDEASLFF